MRQGGEERTAPTPQLSKKDIYRDARSEYRDRRLTASGDDLTQVDLEIDGIVQQAVNRAGVSDPEELDQLPDDLKPRFDALQDYRDEARGEEPRDRPEYGMSVSEAARGYLGTLSRDKKTQQTAAQYGSTLRLFAEFLGDPAVRQLRRRHVLEFIEEVERFDPNWGRSPKTKERSWEELARRYQLQDGELGLSNKTINRYLTAINGMWEWVHRGDDVPPAPITHRLFRPRKKGTETYQPFDDDELKALFGDPRPKMAALWEIALVALYSGLRVNEICSLQWTDVIQVEGVWCIDVKASKSDAGVRQVPLHPRLTWLLERRKGDGLLWPTLKPGGPDQRLSWYFSKAFSAFRRRRGVRRGGLVFHSFRKNAATCLERAGVPVDSAALIIGHERGFTYGTYSPTGLTAAQKKDVVEKMQYPALDGFFDRYPEYDGAAC